MSARRCYTVVCDGPDCTSRVRTGAAFVARARASAALSGWHSTGDSNSGGARDFCSAECQAAYDEASQEGRVLFGHVVASASRVSSDAQKRDTK